MPPKPIRAHPGRATVPPMEVRTPRVKPVLRRLHEENAEGLMQGGQPSGNDPMCQDVSGRFRTCQSHRTPSPAGRKNAPRTRANYSAAVRSRRARRGTQRPQSQRPHYGGPRAPRGRLQVAPPHAQERVAEKECAVCQTRDGEHPDLKKRQGAASPTSARSAFTSASKSG